MSSSNLSIRLAYEVAQTKQRRRKITDVDAAFAQSLTVAWPKLTVNATDFVANPVRAAVWSTPDGGATWTTG